MTEVPLTVTVPLAGSLVMVIELAVPPVRFRPIALLVEFSATEKLEGELKGAGRTEPVAVTTDIDTVAAEDVPAALVAV